MDIFKSVDGQSLCDVCMNTYGSMDFFFKLVQDSNVLDGNQMPYTSQQFNWEKSLVIDAQILRTTTIGNIIYATSPSGNGNTFFVITGGGTPLPPNNGGGGGYIPPSNQNMYQKTSSTNYTATTDGESVITFVPLQGKGILQIERNIQPMLPTEYSWNTTTGALTLTNPMMLGETLFILYTEMITI